MVKEKRFNTGLILIHGGCGASPPSPSQLKTIRASVERGYSLLREGRSAVEAVEAAIVVLEKSGQFNAGKGSKRQMDGAVRMDASLMGGRDLSAGAVAAIEKVLTPIRVARFVMEKTPHLLLVGKSAERVARLFHVAALPSSLLHPTKRDHQRISLPGRWDRLYQRLSEMGTVGAVARDLYGDVAAGTSTGGINMMLPGRVGDSPLIGAGTYADNLSGAVSMTGEGEAIIRAGLAKEISLWMEEGLSPEEAGRRSLLRMHKRIGGHAGAIILSSEGDFAILHTTAYMPAGYRVGRRRRVAGRFQRLLEE